MDFDSLCHYSRRSRFLTLLASRATITTANSDKHKEKKDENYYYTHYMQNTSIGCSSFPSLSQIHVLVHRHLHNTCTCTCMCTVYTHIHTAIHYTHHTAVHVHVQTHSNTLHTTIHVHTQQYMYMYMYIHTFYLLSLVSGILL